MRPRASLRATLLTGILVPVLGFVALDAVSLYREALKAADTAYDRTLLASAKAIGEALQIVGTPAAPRLNAEFTYAALEAFEADNRSRLFYRINGFDGETVGGFADLPAPKPADGSPSVYAALVHFYDDAYRGEPVRMAVLLQPVAGAIGQGMATIQVAETLELRRTLARGLLLRTLGQQLLLLALIAVVVTVVVQLATAPVRRLSQHLQGRPEGDLSPLPAADAPHELRPLVDASNELMARNSQLVESQKRFVRDASHQLRTPLAVLRAQVQSARRGDVEPQLALGEIDGTVVRATELANQMLALAKVEQLRQQADEAAVIDWAEIARAVALDIAPLMAERGLDFELATQACPVRGHAWGLRELTRNLLHNAVKHGPPGSRLGLTIAARGTVARLVVSDGGPGLAPGVQTHLFQPFAAAGAAAGSGLGLAICREIVQSLGGRIGLDNRLEAGRIVGVDAWAELPLAAS
jgi:two-component system sensor histidine kinase TctE